MLKNEIEMRGEVNQEKEKKKLDSIELTRQTRSLDHEFEITS
jgi:hypothetical protein